MRSPDKETELTALRGVLVIRLDVTDKASIAGAIRQTLETFGGIDVLVNNAGHGSLGVLEAASEETIRQQFDVNLFGLIEVTKAVLPSMRQRRSGTIVNVSSIGGKATFPFSTLYHATKFAVEGLTESLQYELNPLGIRLKIVEPGGYKTEFTGRSMGFFGAGGIADYQVPFDRFEERLKTWPLSENIGEVADAIYAAATDGTEQLRYPVSESGIEVLEARQHMDDVVFKKMIVDYTGI
jgi:NAD(P)-dependent dehydrogenase (short-subunit alcohol dehydrogenase family)